MVKAAALKQELHLHLQQNWHLMLSWWDAMASHPLYTHQSLVVVAECPKSPQSHQPVQSQECVRFRFPFTHIIERPPGFLDLEHSIPTSILFLKSESIYRCSCSKNISWPHIAIKDRLVLVAHQLWATMEEFCNPRCSISISTRNEPCHHHATFPVAIPPLALFKHYS